MTSIGRDKPLRIGVYICMMCGGHMFKAKHPWIETCRNFERGCSPDPPSEDMDMGMDLMKEVMKRVAEAFDEFEKDIILKEMNKE